MNTNTSIRAQLVQKLFYSPNPVNKKEFINAKGQLFFDSVEFEKFITSTDSQERVSIAKSILLRIVYQNHFSVPSRLLFNLQLSQEKDKNAVKKGDYIPQDHFVHLVHLYLLGIYFFSYHKTLHNKILADLNKYRRKFSKFNNFYNSKGVLRQNSYVLFSKVWSYFVIYHDIGYPFERILPKKRNAKEKIPYLKQFKKITKSVYKDLGIKTMANLIVLSNIFKNDVGDNLYEMFLNHHDTYYDKYGRKSIEFDEQVYEDLCNGKYSPEEDDIENQKENMCRELYRLCSYSHIPSLEGNKNIQLVKSFVPDEKLIAILENTETGEPIMLLHASQNEISPIFFVTPKKIPRVLKTYKDKVYQFAFEEGIFPHKDLKWHYFFDEPEKYFNLQLNDFFDNDTEEFNKISKYFENNEGFITMKMTLSDSEGGLGYFVFKDLHEKLGYSYYEQDEEDLPRLLKLSPQFVYTNKSIGNQIPNMVGNCLAKIVRKKMESDEFNPGKIIWGYEKVPASKEIVDRVYEIYGKELPQMYECVKKNILENEEFPVDISKGIKKLQLKIRELIVNKELTSIEKEPPSDYDFFSNLAFNKRFTLKPILEKMNLVGKNESDGKLIDELNYINTLLEDLKLPKLEDIINEYKPKWAKEDKNYEDSFIDHGFVSALISFTTIKIMMEIVNQFKSLVPHENDELEEKKEVDNVEKERKEKMKKFIHLCFGIDSFDDFNKLILEKEFIRTVVFNSILLHNVYPSESEDNKLKKYKTDWNKNPFAYLAFLADGLQKWDRKKLISEGMSIYDNFVPGDRYNIEIEENLIKVIFTSSNIDFAQEEKDLRSVFDSYIKDSKKIIKLSLHES